MGPNSDLRLYSPQPGQTIVRLITGWNPKLTAAGGVGRPRCPSLSGDYFLLFLPSEILGNDMLSRSSCFCSVLNAAQTVSKLCLRQNPDIRWIPSAVMLKRMMLSVSPVITCSFRVNTNDMLSLFVLCLFCSKFFPKVAGGCMPPALMLSPRVNFASEFPHTRALSHPP